MEKNTLSDSFGKSLFISRLFGEVGVHYTVRDDGDREECKIDEGSRLSEAVKEPTQGSQQVTVT